MTTPTRKPGQQELERNNRDRVNTQRGKRISVKGARTKRGPKKRR